MKPKILLIGLLLGTAAFAQKPAKEAPVSTAVHLHEAVRALYVESDLTVILTGGQTTDLVVEGEARDVKAVRVRAGDEGLSLSMPGEARANGLKIYVPATQLTNVHLFGKSVLRSSTVLQNSKLKIVLAGEGIVNLSSAGKVLIEGSDGFDFVKRR